MLVPTDAWPRGHCGQASPAGLPLPLSQTQTCSLCAQERLLGSSVVLALQDVSLQRITSRVPTSSAACGSIFFKAPAAAVRTFPSSSLSNSWSAPTAALASGPSSPKEEA